MKILNFVDNPVLRLQLLRCIPAHSPRVHYFRRQLALGFIFGAKILSKSEDPFKTFMLARNKLREEQFDVNDDTNYVEITALISVLDIAIDNGVSKSSFENPIEEKAFNREVDALARVVKGILSRIVDTGASFISRTEAKEALDSVYNRLLYGVRTKEKPKPQIFLGTSQEAISSPQKDFISTFLAKKNQGVER